MSLILCISFYFLFVCSSQVGGVDISTASHEQAVLAIRNAKSPVRFVVRGLATRPPQDMAKNTEQFNMVRPYLHD